MTYVVLELVDLNTPLILTLVAEPSYVSFIVYLTVYIRCVKGLDS